jgi:hypothetical protein
MAEAKGLMKPVKLKNELAEFLGATSQDRDHQKTMGLY